MPHYTYYDSESGRQSEKFSSLPELKEHLASFPFKEESDGIIFYNEEAVMLYASRQSGIIYESPF